MVADPSHFDKDPALDLCTDPDSDLAGVADPAHFIGILLLTEIC